MGRPKGRQTSGLRLLRLVERLRGHPLGVLLADLVAEFAVSRQVIWSDLRTLARAGYSIDSTMQDGQKAVVLVDTVSNLVPLTSTERHALFAISNMLHVYKGTPLFEAFQGIYTKLTAALSPAERSEMRATGRRFLHIADGGTKPAGRSDVLRALFDAVFSSRLVRFTYRTRSGRIERGIMAPYGLITFRHGIYVGGRPLRSVDEANAPRSAEEQLVPFATERFMSAECMDARFTLPEGFQMADEFEGVMGLHAGRTKQKLRRVVLEFDNDVKAAALSRKWERSQTHIELPDRVRLVFLMKEVTEMKTFVLGWGAAVRVLEPADLAQEIADEHARAAAIYMRKSHRSVEK